MKPYMNSDHYVHTDGRILRLGKGDARVDSRNLQFHNYLMKDIAPAPLILNWYGSVTSWGMLANDTLGNCTIASKFHDAQVAALNSTGSDSGDSCTFTDADAIKYYSLWDGYVPGDPNTDQGGVILDVLKDWHQQRLMGHRLFAYTSLNPSDQPNIMKAIELFGITDLGLQLPLSAQSQVGTLWDVASGPGGEAGSWGGHNVTAAAYNETGPIFITWGALQQATWKFLFAYCDEIYSLILGMTLAGKPTGFTGFSLAQLIADQALVAG